MNLAQKMFEIYKDSLPDAIHEHYIRAKKIIEQEAKQGHFNAEIDFDKNHFAEIINNKLAEDGFKFKKPYIKDSEKESEYFSYYILVSWDFE